MKPVGREKDIEIAHLKRPFRYKEGDYFLDGKPLLHWSTNRNDAWELWDELPPIKEYRQNGGYHEVMFLCGKDALTNHIFKGKDFADCVSQAWITWKESK